MFFPIFPDARITSPVWTPWCVLACMLAFTGTAFSQDPPTVPSAPTAPVERELNPVKDQLDQTLELIGRGRAQITGNQNSPRDTADRIKSIKERIDMIRLLVEENEQQRAMLQLQENQQGVVQEAADATISNLEVAVPPLPSEQLTNANLAAHGVGPDVSSDVVPLELADPIDSVQLANSLFLSGNYELALKNYQRYMEQEAPRSHKDKWAILMLASCYRATGDISAAEFAYRDLAATGDRAEPTEIAVEHSQWMLKHLSNRRQLEDRFQSLVEDSEPLFPAVGGNDE